MVSPTTMVSALRSRGSARRASSATKPDKGANPNTHKRAPAMSRSDGTPSGHTSCKNTRCRRRKRHTSMASTSSLATTEMAIQVGLVTRGELLGSASSAKARSSGKGGASSGTSSRTAR